MTPPFVVRTTPRYERLSNKLLRSHADFEGIEDRAKDILSTDPYNRTRRYHARASTVSP